MTIATIAPCARPALPAPRPAPGSPARVLLISLSHQELVRGGAQQVCYELFQGHVPGVEPFLLASSDDSYPAQFKSGARTTGFDGRRDEFVFLSQDYDLLWHKRGSPARLEAFAEFLAQMRPDVVHFHHFLTLGIDLVTLTRKLLPKSRIIFTFHAFMSICYADGHMVRTMDGSLCTNASPVRCHQCFPECTPDHFLPRKMWFQKHLGPVDVFTVPSRFMIDRYADWGLPRERIVQVTNGQSDHAGGATPPAPPGPKRRFGFFGQLIDVKGMQIILRAVRILRDAGFSDFTVDLNADNIRFPFGPPNLICPKKMRGLGVPLG